MNESQQNILEALFEASDTIKTYVAAIEAGNPIPYTILIADDTAQADAVIVAGLRELLENEEPFLNNSAKDWLYQIIGLFQSSGVLMPVWALEEWPDLIKSDDSPGEAEFECVMFKDKTIIAGSRQVVTTEEKMEALRNYAKYKGYKITFEPVKK